MKKAFKILVGFIVFVLLVLLLIPVIFQDKMIAILKEKINENVNAKVEFSSANLSLIKNFPSATIQLSDVIVTNFEPFKGDTLFYGKEINLKLNVTDVIAKEDIIIKSFTIDNAKINVLSNEKGQVNYDISKETSEKKPTASKSKNAMKLSVDSYGITNSQINYIDKKGKVEVRLHNFNHLGTGDFSQNQTELDTETASDIYFSMEDKVYVENLHLNLDALLDLNFSNKKFSFLENKAHINQLPLNFDGFVKLNDKNQEVAISFKTPSSDFKNFLALVPKAYAKNIKDVTTTGNFNVSGTVNGIVDDKHIPKINININSNNASFKYPNLPKGVKNIHINTNIKNTTGLVEDTFVNVNNLSFKIDDNTFNGNAKIKNLTTNPFVNANIKGKLNLADIDKVYPLEMKNKLSGLIQADLSTQFDNEALQKNIYQRIKNNGKISINNFVYASKDVVNPISIKNAEVNFEPAKILLSNFDANTGTTDLKATGTIDNLLGFLLSDKELKGNFSLKSNEFRVSDFMEITDENTEKDTPTETKKPQQEALKVPDFLNCTIYADAKKVYYDNLELENTKGILILKDGKAILKNMDANMFEGKVSLNGIVDTKPKVPVFNMKLDVKSFNISKSFEKLELFKMLAPISSVIQGKLNTTLDLKGDLKNDFTPNLKSIGGNAFAQVLTQKLSPEKSKTMSLLGDKLNFIDLKKLNLDDIKAHLDFKDGKVKVKPFDLKYKDVGIKIGGSHGLDQTMDYNVVMDVPAKYLGTEVTNLLSKTDSKNQNITVPVTANLTGSFDKPAFSTDMSSAVTNITKQLVQQQKKKLIGNTLDKILSNKKSASDSTKTKSVNDEVKDKVNDILGGFFKKKKDN